MKKINKEKTLAKAAVITVAGLTALTVTPVAVVIGTIESLNHTIKLTVEQTKKGLNKVDELYDN